MSKKRRKSRPNIPQVTLERYGGGERKARASADDDFNPDYSYVLTDLKRIGVLAVAFFIVLIALSIGLG